jgi:PIN domain nuclease of toxin-antitoxin system
MRLLLDTHVFMWCVTGNRQLSKAAKTTILEADSVYVSSASIWELAIKVRIGKLNINIEQLKESIAESEFLELPVSAQHAAKVAYLPMIHRDPFDRLLIAQAICEPLIFLTADVALKSYSNLVHVIS